MGKRWKLFWWMEKTGDNGSFVEALLSPPDPVCYRSAIGALVHGRGCKCDD